MNGIKIILMLFFIVLSINLVFAGKIYDLDFSNTKTIVTTINERDVARFLIPFREYNLDKYSKGEIDYKLINKEHKVMIREVENNRNFIRLTIFIQDAEVPQYLNLGFDNFIKLDFDRDSLDDLILKLNKINDKEVTLTFKKINEEEKTGKVQLFGRTKKQEEKKQNPIIGFFSKLFGTKTEEVTAEEKGEEKEDTGLEEITGTTTIRPYVVDVLANNWVLTLIVFIIIFLLVWNKRYIRRKIRRIF